MYGACLQTDSMRNRCMSCQIPTCIVSHIMPVHRTGKQCLGSCMPTRLKLHLSTISPSTKVVLLGSGLAGLRLQFWAVGDAMAQSTTVGAALLPTDVGHLLQLLQRVMECHQDGWDSLLCLFQQVLQVQQSCLILVLIDECRGNSCLPTST